MTQLDKWFTAALVALAVLAIYAVAVGAEVVSGNNNWVVAEAADTLQAQETSYKIFNVDGCDNVSIHFAGQASDSVTVTCDGSIDGVNWTAISLANLSNLDWSSAYSRVARVIQTANQVGGVGVGDGAPARFLKLTIKCAEDTTGGNGDQGYLINYAYGVSCGSD